MKSLLRVILLSATFATAGLTPTTAQTTTNTAVQQIVQTIRRAGVANRQQLIQAAIASDPNMAADLVQALVEAFPGDAAAMTGFVVDSLIAANIDVTVKASILTAVAQSAVNAALSIPPTAVPNLINTVNDVKAALSNVAGESFQQAVASYVTPISQLPQPPQQQQQQQSGNPPGSTINTDTLPTEIIVSNDNP